MLHANKLVRLHRCQCDVSEELSSLALYCRVFSLFVIIKVQLKQKIKVLKIIIKWYSKVEQTLFSTIIDVVIDSALVTIRLELILSYAA